MKIQPGIRTEVSFGGLQDEYRYVLIRDWSDQSPCWLTVIGLNPSTADANQDDPTIRKCIGYARAWGFTGLAMINLFAIRATDPRVMMQHPEPIGPNNNLMIRHWTMNPHVGAILCAWGNHGSHLGRSAEVREYLQTDVADRSFMLKLNEKTQEPSHPLYLKADLKPIRMFQ